MSDQPPRDSTTSFETVQWDLVPGHPAVVVIGAQNDFLYDKGWYPEKEIDVCETLLRFTGPASVRCRTPTGGRRPLKLAPGLRCYEIVDVAV